MQSDHHWRNDIDALEFRPAGSLRLCMVHRLAFRTLIGRLPEKEDCLAWFAAHRQAFETAASVKMARGGAGNFHLTSRDIAGQHPPISR